MELFSRSDRSLYLLDNAINMRWLRNFTRRWGTPYTLSVPGLVWMGLVLGTLVWLEGRHLGLLLIPPFAVTMTILLYLPNSPVAQPFAVIVGSTMGATVGTVVIWILGSGAFSAMVAAVVAIAVLILIRAYHPPGVALAMCPALLPVTSWFPVSLVLPFTVTVVSTAIILSRLWPYWPRYPIRR